MQVYLIRHAQSVENSLNLRCPMSAQDYNALLQRSPQIELTTHGEQQAHALSGKLKHAGIERIYTSPFTRAIQTAAILGEALGLTPHIIDELREALPRPLHENQANASLRRLYIISYLTMLRAPNNAENLQSAYHRAKSVWLKITGESAYAVAAITHAALIGLMLFAIRQDKRWHIITHDLSNAGITIISEKSQRAML